MEFITFIIITGLFGVPPPWLWFCLLTCICILFQNWPSKLQCLEDKVVRLEQELEKSEMNREELSAELMECHKIIESGVSGTENCEYNIHIVPCHNYAILTLLTTTIVSWGEP